MDSSRLRFLVEFVRPNGGLLTIPLALIPTHGESARFCLPDLTRDLACASRRGWVWRALPISTGEPHLGGCVVGFSVLQVLLAVLSFTWRPPCGAQR